MCLAEALLRVPDAATRDRLIRDKISKGDWSTHVGASPSLFVNAAAWGLLVTGRIVETRSEGTLEQALSSLVRKGGEPLIRKGVDLAMRLLGRQFVTGRTIEEALANAREREERGYTFSFDMLGEAAMTARDADRYFKSLRRRDPRDRPRVQRSRDLRRTRHFGEALGAASALLPLAARARGRRADPAGRFARQARARLRHQLQHRFGGSRSARSVARHRCGARGGCDARRMGRPRLRRADATRSARGK